ncbi:hypothetical protein CWT12_12240 [Actinomyces sp. 432]|uniref:phage tail tube protein n=1 Tax=Actinomyces sp. 432 TaxID=2057798 RepID=UPI001373BE5F|nr:hypothetical protein [Actinomyces sp. 432]QHO91921.1 hypothetical protein CWT12_12240 [Actinomyces sp. 432]
MTYALLNAEQVLQFGSDDDFVALAPVGTPMPTSIDKMDPAFVEVGWIGQDTQVFTPSDSVEKRRGHQGNRVYKTRMTESSVDFSFVALQSNLQTLGLQWQIKESSETGGVSRHVLSAANDITEVAIVISAKANGHTYVWACPKYEIGERSDFTLSGTQDTAYTITGTFTEDVILVTDDPNFKPRGA